MFFNDIGSMQTFYVYIVKCNDGSYYTGHTNDLEKRLAEHASGNYAIDSYIASRLPIECVFSEACATRTEAFEAERKIKGWSRKKKEALISGGWQAVKRIWKQK